ncbi:MAG: hypothetical protein ACE5FP_00520 [Gemmatimonadota bacterium]
MSVQAAVRAQESVTPGLMVVPGVVGTGVGLGPNGEPVVKVLVSFENAAALPSEINGVRVEALVTGEFFALQEARTRQDAQVEPRAKPTCGKKNLPPCPPQAPGLDERHPRPVPIGVSTGHPAITAGTIGARVKRGSNVFALSNNHVYADENTASIPDDVIQPGSFDGGSSPADDIGALDDFELIDFRSCAQGGANVIDAAIAATTIAEVGNSTPDGVGYGTPKSQTAAAAVNMNVQKVGRTTGFTKGTVQAINATVNVGYSTGTACFVQQIIVTPGTFSAGGDSGSLVVVDGASESSQSQPTARGKPTCGKKNLPPCDPPPPPSGDDRKPVGLLYAGSSSQTILNPIEAVLTRFGVTIDGD